MADGLESLRDKLKELGIDLDEREDVLVFDGEISVSDDLDVLEEDIEEEEKLLKHLEE